MRYWLTEQVWQRADKWFIIRSRELFSCGTELGNPGLMGYSQSEQRIHFILPTQGHSNLMSPLSFGFFQELLMKNDFLRAYYLGFDWSGWIALIKNRILITKEMSWPVSSDKWKAPLVLTGESGNRHSKKKEMKYTNIPATQSKSKDGWTRTGEGSYSCITCHCRWQNPHLLRKHHNFGK